MGSSASTISCEAWWWSSLNDRLYLHPRCLQTCRMRCWWICWTRTRTSWIICCGGRPRNTCECVQRLISRLFVPLPKIRIASSYGWWRRIFFLTSFYLFPITEISATLATKVLNNIGVCTISWCTIVLSWLTLTELCLFSQTQKLQDYCVIIVLLLNQATIPFPFLNICKRKTTMSLIDDAAVRAMSSICCKKKEKTTAFSGCFTINITYFKYSRS